MGPKQHVERLQPWAWSERSVDPAEDHFALLYGSAEDSDWSQWVAVARVGRPIQRVFGVQFLIDRATATRASMVDAVVAELDFYLLNQGDPNPWGYAKYHCGTCSNLYSCVHWTFHQGTEGRQERILEPRRYTVSLRKGRMKENRRVATLRDACLAVCSYVEKHGLGARDWHGGEVQDSVAGRTVAYISYNGQAWVPGSWPPVEITELDQ